jgi:hypothetical protein
MSHFDDPIFEGPLKSAPVADINKNDEFFMDVVEMWNADGTGPEPLQIGHIWYDTKSACLKRWDGTRWVEMEK